MSESVNRSEPVAGDNQQRLSTGISGLDEVLYGGFLPNAAYLIHGKPGSGKTILGLHFLMKGAELGQESLFITMGETEEQIRRNAARLGFNLVRIQFLDLAPTSDFFALAQSYDIFSPSDVEREPTTERIIAEVKRIKPTRIFIDTMTHFRYFASDDLQFRRQTHSFLRFLIDQGATVLFASEDSYDQPNDDLQYLSDGIICLSHNQDNIRNLTITKFRGSDFLGGKHAVRLGEGGMLVYPLLQPSTEIEQEFMTDLIASGIPELDELLHGGLERGTITMISGPTGVGKTILGMQFMKEAAGRGERSVIYVFEEFADKLMRRSLGVSIPVTAMAKRGTLEVVQVEPLRYTPEEFAHMVRKDVEENGAAIVMIDSISGYGLSLRGESILHHIHALGKYLQSKNVGVIFINSTEEIIGSFRATDVNASYMTDTVIFLRFLELRGELRRAIGVLKKRHSDFEKTLREFEITRFGLKVGKPLTDLRGVLSGIPVWDDTSDQGL